MSAGRRAEAGAPAELIGLSLWFLLFTRLHSFMGKDIGEATANALALQSAERAIQIDIERGANAWLAAHVTLSHLAVDMYRLYYVVVAGVLLWVHLRHAAVYPQVRRTLVAMTILVLPIYWLAPMSPPRFAMPGVVDIVARYDIVARGSGTGENHYSAMPSMHVGWSLWCAYAVWSALRGTHPRVALLAWIFPLLMTADVIGTGNHYVFDIAGSVILLTCAVVAGRLAGHWKSSSRPAA